MPLSFVLPFRFLRWPLTIELAQLLSTLSMLIHSCQDWVRALPRALPRAPVQESGLTVLIVLWCCSRRYGPRRRSRPRPHISSLAIVRRSVHRPGYAPRMRIALERLIQEVSLHRTGRSNFILQLHPPPKKVGKGYLVAEHQEQARTGYKQTI